LHGKDLFEDCITGERLHDVFVRADLESGDSVLHLIAGGAKDDPARQPFGALLDLFAERKSVLKRHHDVEEDDIGGAGFIQRLLPVPRLSRLVAGALEVEAKDAPKMGMVLGDQDAIS